MPTLICEGCGKKQEFVEEELLKYGRAFAEGWDAPDWCPVTTCPTCSTAMVLLRQVRDYEEGQLKPRTTTLGGP